MYNIPQIPKENLYHFWEIIWFDKIRGKIKSLNIKFISKRNSLNIKSLI